MATGWRYVRSSRWSPQIEPADEGTASMKGKKPTVDQDLIRELAALLDETGLTEIEIEQDMMRVRVVRGAAPPATYPSSPPQGRSEPATPPPTPQPVDPASHSGAVLSPMVGTAYLAPEPGGKPYVEVGDRVEEGETVLIVEAMKTMNQIPAPHAGTVVRIIVEDGRPVEYGEPLMIIE
jgi:acetyl-CoA carboxylase biotin carboxyl carrier protein